MQGPTHFCAGVLIQDAMGNVRPDPLRHFLVGSLSFLSHGVLDRLAKCTYHPPAPLPHDLFWVSYHIIIAFLTVGVFVAFWRQYKLGLIFSVLPDLDWVVIHGSKLLSVRIPFWEEPLLHKLLSRFLDLFCPLKALDALPDWTTKNEAALLEMGLLVALMALIYVLQKKKAGDSGEG